MTIHPQIIEKNGNKEFVVLPYEEFVDMEEKIADYEDLVELRKAKSESKGDLGSSLAEIRSSLDI